MAGNHAAGLTGTWHKPPRAKVIPRSPASRRPASARHGKARTTIQYRRPPGRSSHVSRMHYLVFLIICFVWGGSFLLMKKAVLAFSPAGVGAWRIVGGALALAAIAWWQSRRPWLARARPAPMAIVVLLGFAWPFCLQPYLIARDGSAFIGMMVSFTPLLTILVSIPLLGIYPTARQLTGVLGALGFLGLLMVDGLHRQIPWQDLVLAMTVPLSYAVTNVIVRRWLHQTPSLDLSCLSLTWAAAVMVPLAWLGPWQAPDATGQQMREAVLALAVLGVIGTGIGTFLFTWLIQNHGPLFAGMVTNVVPVGALAWGWLDDERVTRAQLAALAGLIAMVTVVQFGTARPGGK